MRTLVWSLTIGLVGTGLWPSIVAAQAIKQREATSFVAPSASTLPVMSEGDQINLNLPTTEYRLGPGDQIQVTVYEQAEVSGPHIIAPDGRIMLPMIGAVQAAGQTTNSLAEQLRRQLSALYKNPLVTITVNQFRPLRIHVGGEVQRPGPQQIRNTTYDRGSEGNNQNGSNPNLPTLSAAIVQAGGVTRNADLSRVILRRDGASLRIDLWQGLTSESAARDLLLRDGDAIFVAKRTDDSPVDPRLIATSTLAPTTVRVRVVGEVKNPGEVSVTPNSTISSAIAIAGGPTDKARMEEVRLVRLDRNNKIVEQKMNLQQLQDNQQILDGDVVIVPKSRTSNFIDVAGQVIPPLGILFNLFRRN